MLIRELGLSEEDLIEYKNDEWQYGKELYNYVKGSAKKRIVWSRDMGLAYGYREVMNSFSQISKVLNEIKHRDPNFKVTSILDFGCGTGAGYLAAKNIFRNEKFTYTGVDSSKDMLLLAEEILFDGNPMAVLPNEVTNINAKNGIFLNRNFPNKKHKFDIVIIADVLWDMASNDARYDALFNAWLRTGKYLVVIDRGGREGHFLTQLARGFILSQGRYARKLHKVIPNLKDGFEEGYTYAPCPHDKPCKLERSCWFSSRVNIRGRKGIHFSLDSNNNYTYTILKKGNRKNELNRLNAEIKQMYPDMKEEEYESLSRQDTKELQGELPWPRLLSQRNGEKNKPLSVKKKGKYPEMFPAVEICMPDGKTVNTKIRRHEVSPASWYSLTYSKFGDRLAWFNFNTFSHWQCK